MTTSEMVILLAVFCANGRKIVQNYLYNLMFVQVFTNQYIPDMFGGREGQIFLAYLDFFLLSLYMRIPTNINR